MANMWESWGNYSVIYSDTNMYLYIGHMMGLIRDLSWSSPHVTCHAGDG